MYLSGTTTQLYVCVDLFNVTIFKHTNVPKINKEFILQENSEDEEHNSFHRHGKQILPDKIPG